MLHELSSLVNWKTNTHKRKRFRKNECPKTIRSVLLHSFLKKYEKKKKSSILSRRCVTLLKSILKKFLFRKVKFDILINVKTYSNKCKTTYNCIKLTECIWGCQANKCQGILIKSSMKRLFLKLYWIFIKYKSFVKFTGQVFLNTWKKSLNFNKLTKNKV